MREYLDFALLLEGGGSRDCLVRVLHSPAGPTGTVPVAVPLSLWESGWVERLAELPHGASRADEARALGAEFFDAVFPGPVRDAFLASVREGSRRSAGLRVRVLTSGSPALTGLPWELLYGPDGLEFLALSSRTAIVRHVDLPEKISPLEVEPPLRVLVVMPDALSRDLEHDRTRLWTSLSEDIRFERIADGFVDTLRSRLQEGAHHVVHLLGQAHYDAGIAEAVLCLEGTDGQHHHLSSAQLGELARANPTLRLVLMDLRREASGPHSKGHAAATGGPAPLGVPAGITLPPAMPQQARNVFLRDLYRAVAAGRPVEDGVAGARRSVRRLSGLPGLHPLAWGAPLLYVGPSGGRVFRPIRSGPSETLSWPDDSAQSGTSRRESSREKSPPPVSAPPPASAPASGPSGADPNTGGRSLAEILREAGIEAPTRGRGRRWDESDDDRSQERRREMEPPSRQTVSSADARRASSRNSAARSDGLRAEPSTGAIPGLRPSRKPDVPRTADGTTADDRRRRVPATGLDPVRDEDVQFSLYRPAAMAIEEWASLLVMAHKSDLFVDPRRGAVDPLQEVRRRAEQLFGETPTNASKVDALAGLARGTGLRVVPDLPGVVCNPPAAEFMWEEEVHEAHFRVRPKAALAGMTVRGTVRIWCDMLIVGELPVSIPVLPPGRKVTPAVMAPVPGPVVNRYRKIFPSYSHRDSEVVEHFATTASALGDEYLQDVHALRAGERWNDRLLALIAEADVFQLFWSTNSMRSSYCRQEWEHALSLNRPSFVRPIYWESPLPEDPIEGLPPEALRVIHFAQLPRAWSRAAQPPSAPAAPAPGSPDTDTGEVPAFWAPAGGPDGQPEFSPPARRRLPGAVPSARSVGSRRVSARPPRARSQPAPRPSRLLGAMAAVVLLAVVVAAIMLFLLR